MADFTILMYEDEVDWKESFEYGIRERVRAKGRELVIRHRENGDTIEQDLMMYTPNLIMVDHDLGESTGKEVIELLVGDPDYARVSIFYYSGGESLDDLRKTAANFVCQIRCFTKEGDNLDTAVLNLV